VKNERKQCPSWEDMDHLHGKRYVFVAGKWGATIFQRLTQCSRKQIQGRDAITKTFEFTDFSQAWSFMSRSALYAEKVGLFYCCIDRMLAVALN
jgi:hypothetical protein